MVPRAGTSHPNMAVGVVGTVIAFVLAVTNKAGKCGCWIIKHQKNCGGEMSNKLCCKIGQVKPGYTKANSNIPVNFSMARI